MNANKPFACDVCGRFFKQKINMITHTRIHNGVKPFQCDICDRTFTQSSNLAKHKRIHTGEKPYECDICEKTCSTSSNLTIHRRIHTGEKPYVCDICEKTFTQSIKLVYHKRMIHTGEKPYSCEMCQKSYFQKSDLVRHYKTTVHLNRIEHTNTNTSSTENTFINCGETIKEEDIKEEINDQENVADPLFIHQETENSNVCENIREEITEKNSIVGHYQTLAKKVKEANEVGENFGCSFCEKKFSSKIMLLLHIKSVGGCKYSCKYCEFTFMKESDLNNHLNTHKA